MTSTTQTRNTPEGPDYYIGRFSAGKWVRVTREPNGNGLKVEIRESVRPYGDKGGDAA